MVEILFLLKILIIVLNWIELFKADRMAGQCNGKYAVFCLTMYEPTFLWNAASILIRGNFKLNCSQGVEIFDA